MSAQSSARRAFLKTSVSLLAAAPFVRRSRPLIAQTRRFDPDFAPAFEAAQAIRSRAASSRELTEHLVKRIATHNPKINAIVTLATESALAGARAADDALARGEVFGPLHGVPMTIKDLTDTAGIRTTNGSVRFKDRVPDRDAIVVKRLRQAGAIILGKTNTPEAGNDYQTYNDVFGTTNNPWRFDRTSGGSSGGCAASLAAGLTYLSIGSDMGGSIRCPAHFCGVYGHRPTLNVVPSGTRGSIDGQPISTQGPLARHPRDLRLAMEIIGGPADEFALANKWSLSPPRQSRLRDYRVGFVLDDPTCPVTPEVKAVMAHAIDALRKAGVQLTEGWPANVVPAEQLRTYIQYREFLSANSARDEDMDALREIAATRDGSERAMRAWAWTVPHKHYLATIASRRAVRDAWQAYFETHDVFLTPMSFVTAFPHDHTMAPRRLAGGAQFDVRVIPTSLGPRPYLDYRFWPGLSSLTGLPATSAFAGIAKDGLPAGMQILGAYWDDGTTIDFAARFSELMGGFQTPPGFA
jgi:amidase